MRGVILQVRLDSTRLPRKALLDLSGLKLIEHVMRAIKKIDADKYIVATTEDSIDELKPLISKWDLEYFVGSKTNVLKRYIDTIDKFGLTQVVRATGDNPLVSYELANSLITLHNLDNNDYSGFKNTPLGTGVEVFNSKALREAYFHTNNNYDLEHVTPFLYNNPDNFKINIKEAPEKYLLPGTFVTVDTKEDFHRIEKLFSQLYHGDIIQLESVITWLKNEQS